MSELFTPIRLVIALHINMSHYKTHIHIRQNAIDTVSESKVHFMEQKIST